LSSNPSSSIRRSARLNKKMHEQHRKSPEFVDLEKEEMEPTVTSLPIPSPTVPSS